MAGLAIKVIAKMFICKANSSWSVLIGCTPTALDIETHQPRGAGPCYLPTISALGGHILGYVHCFIPAKVGPWASTSPTLVPTVRLALCSCSGVGQAVELSPMVLGLILGTANSAYE